MTIGRIGTVGIRQIVRHHADIIKFDHSYIRILIQRYKSTDGDLVSVVRPRGIHYGTTVYER
jgi:hypothetical protein